jgi:hypothetical protein
LRGARPLIRAIRAKKPIAAAAKPEPDGNSGTPAEVVGVPIAITAPVSAETGMSPHICVDVTTTLLADTQVRVEGS